jgi:hypothetical protein
MGRGKTKLCLLKPSAKDGFFMDVSRETIGAL